MKNELQTYVSHIEKYLDGCFDFYEFEPQAVLFDSMRYSLLAGGKRLRPVFVFDFWPDGRRLLARCHPLRRRRGDDPYLLPDPR